MLWYMGRTSAETPRARALAELLTKEVKDAGISARELGKRMGVSHVTIGRWIRGETRLDPEDVAAMLAHLGVNGEQRDQILALARGNHGQADWLTTGAPGVSQQLAGVMHLERTANQMLDWSPAVVPGLLQTRDYAEAILSSGSKLPVDEVQHRVDLRMARRDALMRTDPIQLDAFVGEPAVLGGIGGRRVMVDQLRYLLKMADRFDSVTIRMVSLFHDWHPGLMGPFLLYDFPDLPSIVHLEHHSSGAFLYDKKELEAYQDAAATLRRVAHDPGGTRAMIAEKIREWETTE